MQLLDQQTLKKSIDLRSALPLIEQAYRDYSAGKLEQPPVGHLTFPESSGDCHIKYGAVRGDAIFVIKVATGFPDNPAAGLAVGNGLSLVLSAKHGNVLAVLHDEMFLTDVRTAIGSAIATRSLMNE